MPPPCDVPSFSGTVARSTRVAALPREGPIPYDPAAYRAVYLAWLRHRRVTVLEIDRRLSACESVYEIGGIAGELTPNRAEVDDVMREVEVASLEDPRS